MEFIKKAADKGVNEAQYALGVMYATGEDVPLDMALSRHRYGQAAQGGNTTAQFEYGFMLLLGEGGAVDFKAGKKMLEAAANAGEYQAAKLLAECYQDGLRGFPADVERWKHWRAKEESLAGEIKRQFRSTGNA